MRPPPQRKWTDGSAKVVVEEVEHILEIPDQTPYNLKTPPHGAGAKLDLVTERIVLDLLSMMFRPRWCRSCRF